MNNSFRRKDGSLTHEHFQLKEFRQVAQMRWDGMQDDQIVETATRDNIFQFPTRGQIPAFTRGLLNRLDAISDIGLIGLAARGTADLAAQINLYAMMRVYKIIEAFMVEEIGRRFMALDYTLEPIDINAFMTRYQLQDEQAATWSDSTIKRIRTVLVEILVKAGYLADRSSTELIPVFLESALEDVIYSNGNAAWLPAFNCMEAMA